MRRNRSGFVLIIFLIISLLGGCTNNASDFKLSESTTVPSSETTIVQPTNEPSPSLTPTPTPTPTVTPSPTPIPEYIEPTIDEIWYNGFVDPRSIRAQVVTNPDDITVLINKYYALPLDYVPEDLVVCDHSYNQQLREEAATQWDLMYEACLEESGQALLLISGYRDSNTQQYLFDRSTNLRGITFSVRKNALPGRSEHQLGLALDITYPGSTNISDSFGETTAGIWVNGNAHEYGFVRRFQSEYKYETGYDEEAWHYRYVGVELATYLYENNMSLERYYDRVQIMPDDE